MLAKLGESIEEIKGGGFELAIDAVKSGVDNFLAQELQQALNQVQVGRIRRQKHLDQALIGQPELQGLVLAVAGVVTNHVHRPLGVGREQFFVEALHALGVDAVGFVQVDLRGR